MPATFQALPTEVVRALQSDGLDAYGRPPERAVSDGNGNPCRHCLREIPKGAGMLILAYSPFPALQPYAETGPIFLCAAPCVRCESGGEAPPVIAAGAQFLIRGYTVDNRILYGTGGVVEAGRIAARAEDILADARVAYIHLRSASNSCYQCRLDRG